MNFSEISHKALHHFSIIPPRSWKPLFMTLIPIITQIIYKRIRYSVYQNSRLLYGENMYQVYREGGTVWNQRNDQHKLFLIIGGAQTVAFIAFALRNRYYLLPAVYTLGHLVWTNISKNKEVIRSERKNNMSIPVSFCSMDIEVPFNDP